MSTWPIWVLGCCQCVPRAALPEVWIGCSSLGSISWGLLPSPHLTPWAPPWPEGIAGSSDIAPLRVVSTLDETVLAECLPYGTCSGWWVTVTTITTQEAEHTVGAHSPRLTHPTNLSEEEHFTKLRLLQRNKARRPGGESTLELSECLGPLILCIICHYYFFSCVDFF